MLTLTGILAFMQVWMFLILIRKLYSYTAIQLTKYNYKCQYNTKTFTNMSTNTSVKSTCQYNTKTCTNISTNTSTKSSICIYMDTNKDIEKFL